MCGCRCGPAARAPRRAISVSARRVATWQSSVAEPCYACSTEWFVRWIASLRSQRLRFVSARHVLQPRLSARISVAQQQSACLCSSSDQTAVHMEYHRHHHPFWYSGNYAKRTPLHHKNSFASNAAYRHSGKMALAQTSSCAV